MTLRLPQFAMFLAASLLASTAYADTIEVDFVGSVTSIGGSDGPGNGVISVGDTIVYSFTFEEATAAFATGATRFLNATTAFSGTVGGYSFGGTSGDVFVRNDGTAGSLFGGNPFDQLTISNNNAAVYAAGFGLTRDDFVSHDGDVAGFPLRSVSVAAQTDDTSLLANLDLSEAALQAISGRLDLLAFSMQFMDGAFGSVPVSIGGSFTSVTVTNLDAAPVPLPAAAWLLGSPLALLAARCRRGRA